MKPSFEQYAKIHTMLREVSKHVGMAEWKVKELVKYTLGIEMGLSVDRYGITWPLSMSKYQSDEMSDMINEVRAWANTDLNFTFAEDRMDEF